MITPIEKYKDILLKRDDLFNVGGLTNGGKLRQALYLIEKNAGVIEEKYYGNVVCSCSNKSPQSAIISEVCELYGFKSKIVTCKTDKPNLCLTIAKNNNSEIYGTKVGWNSVIEAKARQLFGFNIKMGFASDDIIEANIPQVQNLPRDLDYLVVPVGSGYNFISIMKGLERYQIPVGRVIGVWVGKNPTELIRNAIHPNQNYILHQYSASYSTSLKKYGNDFDEIYEAKAYDWLIKNIDTKKNKVLLWVIGKRNYDVIPEKIRFL